MTVHVEPENKPQFAVVAPCGASPIGTAVRFNGIEVQNVHSVDVSNTFDLNDTARSRITIELVGESVLVVQGER